MAALPKVVMLATGGTIASRYDPTLGRKVASQRAEDLLAMIPGVEKIAHLEFVDHATMPSFDMTLAFAHGMSNKINAILSRADVSGVVITHGTDTMEETSYLADLLLVNEKPAVFTGAQRAHDDPNPDGPSNIMNSVRVAASADARGLGAMICFDGRIEAARDVVKTHASALGTFQSLGYGSLGEVDGERVIIHRRPNRRRTFSVAQLEEHVSLFRLSLGVQLDDLRAMVERGIAGLVIECFGRGNGPTGLTAIVREAVKRGTVVLITSRCDEGRVEPIYGGGGGGRDLADAGAIFAGDLKGPKARLLLMVLLSHPNTRDRIGEWVGALAP